MPINRNHEHIAFQLKFVENLEKFTQFILKLFKYRQY